MNTTHARPTENSDDGAFARQLLELIGPAYQAPDGSANAAEFLAHGGAYADVRAILRDALDEAFANTAWDLLSDLERIYGLPVREDMSETDRQQRLVAKIRAARAGSPQDMLRALRVYDPTVTIHENTPSTVPHELDAATYWGASRGVFVFGVTIAAAVFDDVEKLPAILALIEQMKPAYSQGNVGVNADFLADDPNSLTNRDLLGA